MTHLYRAWSSSIARLQSGAPKTGSLAADTAWNGGAQVVPQIISLATVPILLSHLGVDGYGVWALTNTLIIFAVSLDGGMSSSAQRFFALYLSRGDAKHASRLTTTLTAAAIGFAALLYVIGPALAQFILAIVRIPESIQPAAIVMFRNLGILVLLMLLSNILGGYLQAAQRFRAIAISAVTANLTFLAGLLYAGDRLTILRVFILSLMQIGVLNVMLAINARHFLRTTVSKFLPKQEVTEFYSYAWRTQITNASALAILQTDSIFVAILLPIDQLGYLAIGGQVATAVRSIPMFALAPLLSRLTRTFGGAGMKGVTKLANLQNGRWVSAIAIYATVAVPAVAFAVRAWAGPYQLAELAAAVLTFGNCFNLLPGVASSYCRAIGRPGIEARYSLVLVVGNMALSWPCTYFWGLPGAVGSTAAVQLLACVYFYSVIHRKLPAFETGLSSIHWVRIAWIATLTLAFELGSTLLPSPSVLAFAATAIAAIAVIWLAGMSALRDIRSALSDREAFEPDA